MYMSSVGHIVQWRKKEYDYQITRSCKLKRNRKHNGQNIMAKRKMTKVKTPYWRIPQSSPSTLSPSIPDPGETAELQYTVNNLVPETLYIFHIIARNEFGDSLSKSVKCATAESMYEVVYIIC
jgi:hypothetical protein